MAREEETIAVTARWVIPVETPPIDGGSVLIRGEQILAVGRGLSGDVNIDLGHAAILPGLINCHTHLEFSHLPSPVAPPRTPFPAWIRAVLAERTERRASSLAEVVEPEQVGLAELQRTATIHVGEIATQAPWPRAISDSGSARPYGTRFLELIGTQPAREAAARAAAIDFLAATPPPHWQCGLSPHAPYTVSWSLLDTAVQLAIRHRIPLAMHVAETREERQLLEEGSGPLRELLEQLGAWHDGAIPVGRGLDAYWQRLAEAPRVLVIHANYIEGNEIDFLANHRDTISVIYCPRTHAYFGHDPYRLSARLRQGVHLALGTDSRASNPDLSMFGEVRWLVEHDRDIDPEMALRLATLEGAVAMSCGEVAGTIAPRKSSALAVVRLPHPADNPFEAIFDSSSLPLTLDAALTGGEPA